MFNDGKTDRYAHQLKSTVKTFDGDRKVTETSTEKLTETVKES